MTERMLQMQFGHEDVLGAALNASPQQLKIIMVAVQLTELLLAYIYPQCT